MQKKYWIVGHPLSFCLCTPVMNGAFKELSIDSEFETHDVEAEKLEDSLKKIRNGELSGVVATMPHKTPSIEFLDEVADEAKAINAVNLILNEDGKLKGYNTDWIGAVGALKTIVPTLSGKKILVLGAGGAARAAAYGLSKEGAELFIWNRTSERAKDFAGKMNITWVESLENIEVQPDIIINATSVSYQPRQSTLIPFSLWKNVEVAMDAVYGKTSLFLEEAMAARVPNIISGEVWFLNQVIPMFKIITGQEAPTELMDELVKKAADIVRA